jgi:hypothetical protein
MTPVGRKNLVVNCVILLPQTLGVFVMRHDALLIALSIAVLGNASDVRAEPTSYWRGFDVSIDETQHDMVSLKGEAKHGTLVNCAWDKKLSVDLATEAPVVILKCVDGGPGVTVGPKRH